MKNRTTIYIEEDLQKKIKIFAIEHEVPISKLIGDIMNRYINDWDGNWGCDYPKGGYR